MFSDERLPLEMSEGWGMDSRCQFVALSQLDVRVEDGRQYNKQRN
jgi:hypothetical protein